MGCIVFVFFSLMSLADQNPAKLVEAAAWTAGFLAIFFVNVQCTQAIGRCRRNRMLAQGRANGWMRSTQDDRS
jgi:hypothetical protein